MKNFIHLNDFPKQEIFQVFELADKLSGNNIKICVNPYKYWVLGSPILDLIAK